MRRELQSVPLPRRLGEQEMDRVVRLRINQTHEEIEQMLDAMVITDTPRSAYNHSYPNGEYDDDYYGMKIYLYKSCKYMCKAKINCI